MLTQTDKKLRMIHNSLFFKLYCAKEQFGLFIWTLLFEGQTYFKVDSLGI